MQESKPIDAADLPQVLTVKQFAEFMQLAPATVSVLCLTGKIVAVKVGKSWRIPRSSIPTVFIPPPPADPLGFKKRAKAAADRLADM